MEAERTRERSPRARTDALNRTSAEPSRRRASVRAGRALGAVCLALASCPAFAGGLGFPQPGDVAQKTLREDFKAPPPGYGEVPFWWWSGKDPLDKERMLWQIEEMHKAGIPGVQVNYAHHRTNGWPTQDSNPALFTAEWWDVFSFVARECAKRNMGISLSNYTLDFPGRKNNLWKRQGISTPDLRAWELSLRTQNSGGGKVPPCGSEVVSLVAAPLADGRPDVPKAVSLDPRKGGELPPGKWRLFKTVKTQRDHTLDPINPESGKRVVERFFNQFLENVPKELHGAFNYFFQDELMLAGDILWMWSDDFAAEFKKRKGYDLPPLAPALFGDWGPDTVKVRLDMNDVMSALACERYFKPIYDWHASRNLVYGCDQATRGLHPMNKYIDYMRTMKYFTAPGFDTPGASTDIIKNKVGSSIAHLYRRPRVWLEGYHSQGWQASTSTIFDSTCHNFLYGANLLNLHGLYYSTYGGWWEWAPPCYHFRMPYWTYMKTFLKYFERLSYILSQGAHVCDVAVVNPLEPCVYNRNRGNVSVGVAHNIVKRLVTQAQTDVDFIDADSIAAAKVENGRLLAADEMYKTVILPDMIAVRRSTVEKLVEFKRSGGKVFVIGETPKFTDAPHTEKTKVDAMIAELVGNAMPANPSAGQLKAIADAAGTPDFRAPGAAKALHRRIGKCDVYFICDLSATGECTFRSHGTPELWNPWDGSQASLPDFRRNADGTTTVRIDGDGSPRLVVFADDGGRGATALPNGHAVRATLPGAPQSVVAIDGEWDFTLKPTLDNKWGDFRLPVRERYIGAEIRRVKMAGADKLGLPAEMTVGFGPQFLDGNGSPFLFSWREGVEGMPGFQDWHHGLNGVVGDDFFVLGPYDRHLYDVAPRGAKPGVHSYRTFVYAPCNCKAKPVAHGVVPKSVALDGKACKVGEDVALSAGFHELTVGYEAFGRAALVMMRTDVESVPSKTPLSMRWHEDPAVLPFDPFGGKVKEGVYTATLPPACEEIAIRMRGTLLSANIAGSEADVERVDGGYRVKPRLANAGVAALTLKVAHEPGFMGGAAFTEPMRLKCGKGRIALGNWARIADGLRFYSGGAVYEKSFALTEEQAARARVLDLGGVGVCCGVSVNGGEETVLCCPPWRIDVAGKLKEGANSLKVTVYNTLNNHYQTIPTRYRTTIDRAPSGLLGPVSIRP